MSRDKPPPFRLVGEEYSYDRPDGYRRGCCSVCRRDTLVCAGVTLQAPDESEGTVHPICDDCIIRARTPRRRAALRAALDAKRTA
ncbi:hypothetical protein ACIQBJ_29335 [Kitasatospora sp. NPDC088391]|uniref:hypothetical protein n=1 Tax=Kitasatospora sp. NPDC088391 TaxID=3364074 RepID=UPI003815CC05